MRTCDGFTNPITQQLLIMNHIGSWQLLVIRTNGVWRSHQTHIVPAEVALLANEVHPSHFKSSDRNTPCLRALPPASNQTKKEVSKAIKRRERRVIIHQQVWELRHQGLSGKAIAKK